MVDYLIPTSLKEVIDYIDKHESKMISGATDLMVQRKVQAEILPEFKKNTVYIFNLEELKYITSDERYLHIGACTPVSDILNHKDTPKILKDSIEIMASPALRNLATLPGNIVNASPAGDTLPILYCLDAMVRIESVDGSYEMKVEDVIKGPRRTSLKSNEIITEVIIPLDNYEHQRFVKVGGRKADAISKISFTGLLKLDGNRVKDLRLAFGAVGPVVVRKRELEKKYIGIDINELKKIVDEVTSDYDEFITPIDDQRSNKEYRKKVALNLLRSFIKEV